jgi:hypothetical protein
MRVQALPISSSWVLSNRSATSSFFRKAFHTPDRGVKYRFRGHRRNDVIGARTNRRSRGAEAAESFDVKARGKYCDHSCSEGLQNVRRNAAGGGVKFQVMRAATHR